MHFYLFPPCQEREKNSFPFVTIRPCDYLVPPLQSPIGDRLLDLTLHARAHTHTHRESQTTAFEVRQSNFITFISLQCPVKWTLWSDIRVRLTAAHCICNKRAHACTLYKMKRLRYIKPNWFFNS